MWSYHKRFWSLFHILLHILWFSGFTLDLPSVASSEYGNDEAIYRSLKNDAEENEPVVENVYDVGITEDEKTSGEIYDSIVCQRSDSRREKIKESDVSIKLV